MGALISENFGDLLAPGLRKIFVDFYLEQKSMLAALFGMETSSKAQEFDLEDGPIADFESMTGPIPYDDSVQGYKTTYTHSPYARGFKVARDLVDDDLYNIINRKPQKLAMGARRRRETDGASVLNNAFNASVTGGDSLSLCNSAHTSRQQGIATQSNTGTLQMSPTNVEATRRLHAAVKDSIGGIINVETDLIIAPLQLEETAWEIINSKGKVDTAQNNANFHFGKYKLAVWKNYLTSATAWFMTDSSLMKMSLLWFDRISPEFFKDKDFDTLQAKFAGYMRYSFGWSDWRFIYGQNPS